MRNIERSSVLTAAALGITLGLSGQVSAGQASEMAVTRPGLGIQTVSIAYSRAELSTSAGRAALHARIRHAAREVCGPSGLREAGSLQLSSRNRKCHDEAVGAAINQIESGQLASTGG